MGILNLPAATVVDASRAHLPSVVVGKIHRVVLAVEIAVEAAAVEDAAPQEILLAEAVHLRGVEAGAEIDQAGRGVVVFAVVAEAADLLAELFAEGAVGFCDSLCEACSVVDQLCGDAATPVVDVLRAGAAGDVGIINQRTVLWLFGPLIA